MKRKFFIYGVAFVLLFTLVGITQTATKTVILKSKCVGCGDCARSCPVQAITIVRGKAVIDADKCVACRLCVITCSYGAPR